jgi:hypothetical protein
MSAGRGDNSVCAEVCCLALNLARNCGYAVLPCSADGQSLGGDVAASATVSPFWKQTSHSAAKPRRDVGRVPFCDRQCDADTVFGVVIEKSFRPLAVNSQSVNVCVRTARAADGLGSGAITP